MTEHAYSLRQVQRTLGLSRSAVLALIAAGFVVPARGPRNAYRFSFRDLLLLRTAHALRQAQVPTRRILRSLARLRSQLPAELPLSGLRITAVGADVAVRDRDGTWYAESGQWLMDFEVANRGGEMSIIPTGGIPAAAHARPGAQVLADAAARGVDRASAAPLGATWPTVPSPDAVFDAAEAIESSDRTAAEAGYRRALDLDPTHLRAVLNLGVLLCENGRCDDAARLYAAALVQRPDEPLIHFNHAIALEDQQRLAEALAGYERALVLDPQLADAHYNAGRLAERQGDAQRALRHFSAYRRLQGRHEGR